MGQLSHGILLCPIKIDFGLEWEGVFLDFCFFKTTFILNTIITNDENNEQIFNNFCINLNFIFFQLNLNSSEFGLNQ